MGKKKKIKENSGRKFFDFGSDSDSLSYLKFLKIFAVFIVLVGIGFSFYFLERFVKASPKVIHSVERLKIDKPVWASAELLEKIKNAASSRSEDFVIDDNLAADVARNISTIPWLYGTRVRIAGDSIVVSANWRKPMVVFNGSNRQIYIASDLTVLDYVPLKTHIVELKGIEQSQSPDIGKIWDRADVTAAIEVLRLLDKMDQLTAQKPLINQIAAVDVSNLGGRKSPTEPHIVLIANDGTNIKWGAAVGTSQKYVEASDQEKLAMLYDFYKLNGTLQNIKYVELRYPQKAVPQPSIQ